MPAMSPPNQAFIVRREVELVVLAVHVLVDPLAVLRVSAEEAALKIYTVESRFYESRFFRYFSLQTDFLLHKKTQFYVFSLTEI